MKRMFTLIAFTALFMTQLQAKIWRVNNMPGVVADFTTAQAAHNAASAGDTIHLEPSITAYGNITNSKKLVWLSIGSFLAQNPGLQFATTAGKANQLQVNAGSEGSVFSILTDGFAISVSSVSVIRSHIEGGLSFSNAISNVTVSQTFIRDNVSINNSTQHVISNNILGYLDMSTAATGHIITNNVMMYSGGVITIYNSVFQNNIIRNPGIGFVSSNSNCTYNMHAGAGLPAGNNNLVNVTMSNVFENSTGTADKDFRLKAGSPAIAAGFGGTDMGAFGGTTPFKVGMQPAIPAITSLSTPSSSGNNIIQVTFSAKSNN
jgi:hypothetical protein